VIITNTDGVVVQACARGLADLGNSAYGLLLYASEQAANAVAACDCENCRGSARRIQAALDTLGDGPAQSSSAQPSHQVH
jgi:hypothetical protein